jgi:hypothetical protein
VIDAFLYLTRTTLRNRFASQLRRLRNPRYAIALLLGVGYFWLILLRPAVQPGRASPLVWANAETLAALGILLLLLGPWVFKNERMALAFTPAEVQFLFPAPVTRRQLILYKLFRAQIVILLNALIWVFILRRSGSVLPALLRLAGTWMVFTNLSLHRLGAALVRTSLLEHGRAGLRRQLPAIAIGGAAVVAMLLILRDAVPAIRAAESAEEIGRAIELAAASPAASVLLFIPRTIVGPSFAQTAAEWLRAVAPAAALMLLQTLWVVRTDVAFEEAAAQASLERARRLDAWRRRSGRPRVRTKGKRRTIPLSPAGMPAGAIVWKNTLLLMRTGRLGSVAGLALMAVLISMPAIRSRGIDGRFVAVAALAMAGLLVILGSRVLHNDLRQDAEHLETLKTLPLSGSRLVAAEVLSSALPIAMLQLVLVAVAFVALLGDRGFVIAPRTRGVALVLMPVVLLAVNVTTTTIQNGAALLFPGWVRPTPLAGGGVEAMGQGILATMMLMITFVVALLPAAITFSVVGFSIRGVIPFAWAIALLAAAGVLLLESWLVINALGRRFERMEPSERG